MTFYISIIPTCYDTDQFFSSILGVLVPDQSNKWLDSSFSSHILAFSIFSIEKWNEMLCLLTKCLITLWFLADVKACTKGENQTAVHYAAKNDADNALKMLIKLGADVNCRDYKQRTPLQVAAELGENEWKR